MYVNYLSMYTEETKWRFKHKKGSGRASDSLLSDILPEPAVIYILFIPFSHFPDNFQWSISIIDREISILFYFKVYLTDCNS